MNYLGFEPSKEEQYYFISYNSEDVERISPIVNEINSQGIPLWYDYGISYDDKWTGVIAEKISHCIAVLLFYTQGIGAKEDSYVITEYDVARLYEKPVYVIELDKIDAKNARYSNVDWLLKIQKRQLIKGTSDNVETICNELFRYIKPNPTSKTIIDEKAEKDSFTNHDVKENSTMDVDPEKCLELGEKYYYGDGAPQDYREAVKWYQKAAEQDNAVAQNNLGRCYQYGRGVSRDYGAAAKWYRRAAELDNASAQNNLGYCYLNALGVLKSNQEALKWFWKAAEQDNADAQNNLGWCHQYGKGVPRDYREAKKWYQKAANQGNAVAKKTYGD